MTERRGLLLGAVAGAAWCAACSPLRVGDLGAESSQSVRSARTQTNAAGYRDFPDAEQHGFWCIAESDTEVLSHRPTLRRSRKSETISPPPTHFPAGDWERLEGRYESAGQRGWSTNVHIYYWPNQVVLSHPADAAFTQNMSLAMLEGGRRRHRLRAAHPRHIGEVLDATTFALQELERAGREFRPPLKYGLSINISVMRLDNALAETSPTMDYIKIERMLTGRELRNTMVHEIFHRIQYAYNAQYHIQHQSDDEDRWPTLSGAEIADQIYPYAMWREGSARLAEVMCGTATSRYLLDASPWLVDGRVSLFGYRRAGDGKYVTSGYDAGLFWKYLAEQHGGMDGGSEARIQLAALEAFAAPGGTQVAPLGLMHVRRARLALPGPGDFDRFRILDVSGTPFTACDETSWGNFLVATMLSGSAEGDPRFRFQDQDGQGSIGTRRRQIRVRDQLDFEELPEVETRHPLSDSAGERRQIAGPESGTLNNDFGRFPVGREAEQRLSGWFRNLQPWPANFPLTDRMLPPFAVRPFLLRMPVDARARTRLVRLHLEALSGLSDGLVQVLLLRRDGGMSDLHRLEFGPQTGSGFAGRAWHGVDRTIACYQIAEVIIIVASRQHGGDFRLSLGKVPDVPILQMSNWNARRNRSITESPLRRDWDWKSRDIHAYPADRSFGVSVRNIGTAPTQQVKVEAWVLKASDFPNRAQWSVADASPKARDNVLLATADECRRMDAFSGYAGLSDDSHGECDNADSPHRGRVYRFKLPRFNEGYIVAARASTPGDPNRAVCILGSVTNDLPAALLDMRQWPFT